VVGAGIGDHGDDVDVRADHLLFHALARHLAGKAGAPGQARPDHVVLVLPAQLDGDPIADGGQVGVGFGLVPDLAGEHAVDLLHLVGVLGDEGAVVDRGLADQPRGHPPFRLVRGESGGEVVVPSELGERHPRRA
jgi:hypothetical protein